MFQETDHPATLQQVLDREIECMQTVLSFSRKSLDQMETLSIKVLTESSVWSKSRSRSPFMHMVRILHREHTRGHPP